MANLWQSVPRTRIALWMLATAIVSFLLLLVLAAWIMRDQIYQSLLDPGEPYQTYIIPEAPDYSENSAWYARPAEPSGSPAVFFVHGTTYPGGSDWNAAIDAEEPSSLVIEEQLPNFAAPFASVGDIYAPRYRQAALYTFMNLREDGVAARLTAAADVRLAFAAFLNAIDDETPFMIVGVGQGGLHSLAILIEDVAPSPETRRRLIAAYILEFPLPLDQLQGPLQDISPCETAEEYRCVFSFVSALSEDDDRIRYLTERTMAWAQGGSLERVAGRGLLCTNPILGARTTDYAPARLHRGGAQAAGFREGANPAALPAQTGAQCTDGVLMTEPPRSRSLHRPGRLTELYRLPPFNLFYEDLRADAELRTAAFLPVFEDENQQAPPLGQPEEIEDANFRPIPDRAEDN